MNSELCQGKLLRWNDERGFGFIESKIDSKGVFLHISALGRTPRRPQVGDVILYERVKQADGKVKAEKASIQGLSRSIPQRPTSTFRKANYRKRPSQLSNQRKQPTLLTKLVGLGALVVLGLIFNQFRLSPSSPPTTAERQPSPPPSPTVEASPSPSPPVTVAERQPSPSPSPTVEASPSPSPPVIVVERQPSPSPSPVMSENQTNCTIKGNISISSGKKWYHLPGMEDYENTIIDPLKGERWFCSEQAAIAAGWQKAPE